ncbi:MAG: 3'-5' exonuclease [Bacteroidales bacterium]|nr:3'-5' exonuclease [Bacteroidales bacterium]
MLFIDCEFVDNQEIIELSAWNLHGEEVYHKFYKPTEIKEWPTSMAIHHITPQDVAKAPSFSRSLPEIQKLFDDASYIIGFATSGDINHLKAAGVKRLDEKHIIDVRDMYWLFIGQQAGKDYYSLPGLARCAEELGIEFGDKGAHSASEDTLVTLKCFEALCDHIEGNPYADRTPEGFRRAMDIYMTQFHEAKEEYERKRAMGWIIVTLLPDNLYKVQFKRAEPEDSPELVAKVNVADITRAESDLHVKLQRRQVMGRRGIYRLNKADIRAIRSYSNSFGNSEEHDLSRKLLKLQKQWP